MPQISTNQLFLAQLATTLFMTGLIWFVQIVHYPLFPAVGASSFLQYEALHATRTGWVVFPPMLLELLTACAAVLPMYRAGFVSRGEAWVSAGLVLVIWASTGLLQVPLHNRLALTADPATMHRLVQTNWIRTVSWTLRAALLLTQLSRALGLPSFRF